jgi:hypothetical protein
VRIEVPPAFTAYKFNISIIVSHDEEDMKDQGFKRTAGTDESTTTFSSSKEF